MPSKLPPPRQPRVHVLGLGSIGTFTAHGLNEIAPTPPAVTLLLHRESLYDEYLRNSSQTTLHTVTGQTTHHRGYDLEIYNHTRTWHPPPPSNEPATKPIDHLIVTVKATQTVAALRPLQPRLTPSSTILFLQNGCGTIDEVNEHLFPDPGTRPNYIVGVISHGVTLNAPFEVTHTGASAISLGKVPRQLAQPTQPSTDPQNEENYLLQSLPHSPLLTARTYTTYAEILQLQLEKLAVNAFCNPVCALHNAPNKFLFTQPALRRAVLAEVSAIVPRLPELRGVEGVTARFALDRLEDTVNTVLERTRETTCSMVVDLRAGRETEVRFINGYWVRRGREVGVDVGVNEGLMRAVLDRGGLPSRGRTPGTWVF
ncbi:ketopantoate reductase family protein [Aspergillus aculeatinus CBS 121060]|uniref:2-dehydropantoate 2-reductase family protein n=1 Tax=Aspergillus aculeatinus CBS 121060 TaxID=1448322 RepID=A0ACD1H4X8_9EURO|nr:2-dehydropantoate 2-reductase family protein [Aspergillus aculeatinus CBS 121060]RAH68792.1 2-dehydropantoate 2-reductase family protein [Aspergillus aculeatinus CBS 121060]